MKYTILMMHAGLEGQLAHMGKLRMSDLAPLRDIVDYVALGHIHKPYQINDWIFNPGSLETCSIQEAVQWPDRGAYLVEVNPGAEPPHHAELLTPQERRPFHRLTVEVDALTSPQAVYDRVDALIAGKDAEVREGAAPVVEVLLTGILPFNQYELDLNEIQAKVERAWDPLTVRVRSRITPAEFEIQVESEGSRTELERSVLRQLIERDQRYRADAETWTDGARHLKTLVLADGEPKAVVDHLRRLRDEVGGLGKTSDHAEDVTGDTSEGG